MTKLIYKAVRKLRGLVLRSFYCAAEPLKIISARRNSAKWAEENAHWLTKNTTPLVSIIVPTYNRIGALIDGIQSIRKFTSDYEIIVVNSGSGSWGDRWLIEQSKMGDLILVFDNGRRFGKRVKSQSYFYNLGYKIANGKYVVHFADDCQALPGWMDDVISILESDEQVGLSLFLGQPHTSGKFQHTIYHGIYEGRPHDYPVAHWFCARKTYLASIGYMDESYSYYCNDLDVTVRMIVKLRKRVVCSTKSKILHLDKDLTYREHQKYKGDFERFNTLWSATVGFRADDPSASSILDESVDKETPYLFHNGV